MKQNSQICGTDLFLYAGIKLHIIFGYYSHFPEMALLGNATAKYAISQKKLIFVCYEMPNVVMI